MIKHFICLRVDELSNLKLTGIDIVLKRIRIVGKGMKVRTVPISNTLLAEIQDWLTFRTEMPEVRPQFILAEQRNSLLESKERYLSCSANGLYIWGTTEVRVKVGNNVTLFTNYMIFLFVFLVRLFMYL